MVQSLFVKSPLDTSCIMEDTINPLLHCCIAALLVFFSNSLTIEPYNLMNLVIVESPTKARTIGRFLGKEYEIKASMGHVMDLPKSKLGVDVEDNFKPQFEIMPDKAKIVAELKKAAKSASTIILATDPDREGEAIAQHVREILPISNTTNKPIKRMVFHEITK